MSENIIRHLIAASGTSIALLAWWSGYVSGIRGWWWVVLGLAVIYALIYVLIEA